MRVPLHIVVLYCVKTFFDCLHQDTTKVSFRLFFKGIAKRCPLFLGGESNFSVLQGQVYAADFLQERFFFRQGGRKSRAQDANAENKKTYSSMANTLPL